MRTIACPLLLAAAMPLLVSTGGARACTYAGFAAPVGLPFAPSTSAIQPFAIVDLNGDGKPDLVRADAAALQVSMNLGGGSFAPARTVAAGGEALVTADFDRDGKPDVVLVRGASMVLLLGDGAGGFRDERTIYTGQVATPATGDFDGDGSPDIAFFAGLSAVLTVLPGDGRGGFRPPVASAAPGYLSMHAVRLASADLDRDGRDDLLFVAYPFGTTALVLFANGDGTFRDGYSLGGGFKDFAYVVAADVDADGRPELIVPYTFEYDPSRVTVHFLDTHGAIARSVGSSTSGHLGMSNFAVADLDGDGKADLAYFDGGLLTVMKGDGAGGFGQAVSYPAPAEGALFATDLDDDGHVDVVSGPGPISAAAWYHNTCADGGARTLVVPVLLSSPGAAGAQYETDLTITNVGDTAAHVELTYTASQGGGGGSTSATIPPRSQLSGASAFALLANLGISVPDSGTRVGTLRAEFSGLAFPHAASIDVRVTSHGAGVAFPAVEPPLAGTQIVSWLQQDAKDRSNLGLTNAGTAADGDVTLRVAVVSTDPAAPGFSVLPDITIPPGGFRQIDRILLASGLPHAATSAYASVLRVGSTAPFVAWGVVNDQISSDGSIVPGLATGPASPALRYVPSVVETPSYDTELVLTNTGQDRCDAALVYRSAAIGSPVSIGVTVPAYGAWRSGGVLDSLRAGGASLPPRGATIAGTLDVQASGCKELRIAARVVSDHGDRGRFGVFVPDSSLLWPVRSSKGFVPDLRQDGSVRSNLDLFNPSYVDATYEVEIFSASGEKVATRSVPLPPYGWTQIDSILAGWAPGTARGWARVTSDSPDHPVAAYAIINDGGAPGLGTGDGSLVQMEPEP